MTTVFLKGWSDLACFTRPKMKVGRVSYPVITPPLDHAPFVSRYLVALPKPEQLEQLIETDRAAWEQHHPNPSPIEDQP